MLTPGHDNCVAVSWLTEQLGIDRHEVAKIGDSLADLTFMGLDGVFAGAVANATLDVAELVLKMPRVGMAT